MGKRMSGQEIRVPLVRLPRLDLGGHVLPNVTAGIAAFGAPEENGFDGIVGLDLLGCLPLTIDPFAHSVRLGAVTTVPESATVVPVRLSRDGPAVEMRADLRLPDGRVIEIEVDTGSGSTILNSRFMTACGVDGDEQNGRTVE